MNSMPVWYVEKDGNLIDIIQLEEPDSWSYRQEAKNYPDCVVWAYNKLGWCSMPANNIRSAIWRPSKAPDSIKLAYMIGEAHE